MTDDHDLLIAIDTKLSMALANQIDHETRIRTLEQLRYATAGISALLGIVGGSGIDYLLHR